MFNDQFITINIIETGYIVSPAVKVRELG